MKITIYRYPHPFEDGKWIYTGQTTNLKNRDRHHRKMRDGFGKLFKDTFPGVPLTLPDSYELEVEGHLGANWEETVEIFRNHSWHAEGGMNRTVPGSQDYLNLAKIAGQTAVASGHLSKEHQSKAGSAHIKSGHLRRVRPANHKEILSDARTLEHQSKAGAISGRNNVLSGHLERIRPTPEEQRLIGKARAETVQGKRNLSNMIHKRWHENKGLVPVGTSSDICSLCQNPPYKSKERQAQYQHTYLHVKRNTIKKNCKLCKAA